MNFEDAGYRNRILQQIKSPENQDRKDRSFVRCRVLKGEMYQYVVSALRENFTQETIKKMPIESNINIAKKICNEISACYREEPNREFIDVSDSQKEVLNNIYRDAKINYKLMKANEFFTIEKQHFLQVVPVNGKIEMRLLNVQHMDVVVDPVNPEEAIGYIISAYDETFKVDNSKSNYFDFNPTERSFRMDSSDNYNQDIADPDDYKLSAERYVWWTKKYTDIEGNEHPAYNFVTDGHGRIVSKEIYSPIDVLPFIEIAPIKNFKFFVDDNSNIAEFSIRFLAILSELSQNIRMQAWSQAYLKAEESYLKELKDIEVGPTRIVFLPVNPEPGSPDPEFGYANPGGDLKVGIEYAQNILSMFLSTIGLDPDVISNDGSSKVYNSGFERFLGQLQKAQTSKQDYDIFRDVERQLLKLVTLWHDVGKERGMLDPEYITNNFYGKGKVSIRYKQPEVVQTKAEQIAFHQSMMDAKLGNRVTAIMDIKSMTEDQAINYIKKLDEHEDEFDSVFKPKQENFQMVETQPYPDQRMNKEEVNADTKKQG